MLLLVANTAEARRSRWSNNMTYTQSAPVAHTAYRVTPAVTPQAAATAAAEGNSETTSEEATQASYTSTAASVPVTTAVLSTSTAQGVANIMASYNRVGHWGGNPGYEGCGCGGSPAAAYNTCCYASSGMTTVDVGYARSASGMWYCCRRYR
jgi:hypothetical protein